MALTDFTIAITQNFCSATNIENVYLCARHSRPKLTAKLYRELASRTKSDPKLRDVVDRIDKLQYVPQIPPSSSGSSSSSTSSSSSSEEENGIKVSDTDSETDLSNGTCMCRKCKLRKKKEKAAGATAL